MTLLSAHPLNNTAGIPTYNADYSRYTLNAPMRRIAGLTTSKFAIDVLRNRDAVIRASWDASFTLGTFTIAIVKKVEAR